MAAKVPLRCLAEDVGRRVPKDALAFVRLEVEKLEMAIALERSVEVP